VTEDRIISDMVGRDLSRFYAREKVEIDYSEAIEFKKISGGQVKDISFTVYKGEIVGFAGMVGSGRTDLVRSIFGASANASGEMSIEGSTIAVSNPSQAIQGGLSLLTEDRQQSGLILDHRVKWNVSLVGLGKSKGQFINEGKENEKVNHYVEVLDIKTPSLNQTVKNLSGGNQQKVVLAKWLYAESKVIIFDEPTRGIDIGAKEEIYKLMVELAREGRYILMVSSDMLELIAMCDRVFVMRKGKITAELEGENISEEEILTYSIGGTI
jgi:ribose transport system ATP-binding protein